MIIDIVKKLVADTKGNAALAAGILGVPLIVASGAGLDYSYAYRLQSSLQAAADSAALASAREIGLAGADAEAINGTAEAYVYASAADVVDEHLTTISAVPTEDLSEVKVSIAHVWKPFIMHYFIDTILPLKVSATAGLAGEGTICMIGLDPNMKEAIHLVKKARLEAPGCGVYSNSASKEAIKVEDDGTLIAGVTCAVGGIKAAKKASFKPDPITDCPAVEDPLIDRPTPSKGGCDQTDFEVSSGAHTLYPGTYCDGLKIKGSAEVKLKPGIYYIEGKNLEVTDKATLDGENVGFYLSGDDAKLKFNKETSISLTAPKTGLLAGILVFEDRNAAPVLKSDSLTRNDDDDDDDDDKGKGKSKKEDLKKHEITSDDARLLLGTIYLPNGTLKIDSDGPIADQSAYTAIIARTIELQKGPTLYLNSDYDATDVPVPDGLTKTEPYLKR